MTRRASLLLVAPLALATVLPGCTLAGPASIASGRAAYNEMINKTEDQQVLDIILRERYDETFGMLTVASVTASISMQSSLGAEVGIGPQRNYDGNLVPLAAGFVYEENPTVSYVPLSGEIFYQRTLAPVTLAHAFLMSRAAEGRSTVFRLMIERINGIENPPPGRRPINDEVQELALAFKELHDGDLMSLVLADNGGGYFVSIHDYRDHLAALRLIIDTLKLDVPEPDGQPLLIPVSQTLTGKAGQLNLGTRSALDVIRIIGESIEIPQAHLKEGIVEPAILDDPENEFLRIRSSPTFPEHASVATEFHGYWFYIDSRDLKSKRGFVLIRTLIGMRLYDSNARDNVPTLTLPING